MRIEPEDKGNETQRVDGVNPYYACGWVNDDTHIRSLTYEDEPKLPPNGVTSWVEFPPNAESALPQYGFGWEILEGYELINDEWVLVDEEKRHIYWLQFVNEIEIVEGKTIPPEETP